MSEPRSATLELARELISRASVTPDDAGCQPMLTERLAEAGFRGEDYPFGEVRNLWLRRGGGGPLFVFAGHTDVVPPGPENDWTTPAFEPTERDGMLYGRGAADMKGSVAAFVTATERFVVRYPEHRGSIALLLTSDEEGPARDGTRRVVDALSEKGIRPDWCLVGEPSSSKRVADTIKNGRRGSLSGKLRVRGTQGHVAYPQFADNPVHRAAPALADLINTEWDTGNDHFPPTSFQITRVEAGEGANNVVPGSMEVDFNFRFSTEVTEARLRERVTTLLDRHRLDYELEWHLSGEPFLTERGDFIDAAVRVIEKATGQRPALSTGGGTSDGRFIAPTGAQVMELGPLNATIHKADECVSVADLEMLSGIYEGILEELLAGQVA
ncbi:MULTISPECIES: succinyl-diaminopimelate desuccinylase [Halomonadaceae]|uniref:Succinyl-diaminopimelate desuccinylase n=1 Tax=Vreelandella halophila TaxID=86177 RepID=A0A9X4YA32_9GAMM|nr:MULTISPECIES: succinyl-diaminopimelate desuccinylase [Halomonas]MYL25548.1 succinyl-diaminopimelate desuccinylase [Halomonas utahensis]MYL74784.1 succinyl-diaminopimelate desuccinylase [Halomonas sp. 22501_18_FS]